MGRISVRNVGKAYKTYPSRFGRLAEWVSPFGGTRHSLTWVLRDISFEVSPGEALGVVGVNGAGKSTLLKMITGTTRPSEGNISMAGRVAAMLELGMGFHPDFTGRQNAQMASQLLGYSAEQITELMPAIEEFADIGEYIDHPVRTYSSGMQMRLAFSVATASRPDILIVDEALSVGDAYFQHKSFDRIREFREAGTTLLIVSHDKGAIQSICDRAIMLEHGRVAMEGEPEAVMDYYNARLAERDGAKVRQVVMEDGKTQTISGTLEAVVDEIQLFDKREHAVETINVGDTVRLRVKVKINSPIPRLVLGYMIKDRLGQVMYGTNTHLKKMPANDVKPGDEIVFNFDFPANLGEGSYSIATALVSTDTHLVNNYEWRDLAMVFHVENRTRETFIGCTWLDPQVTIQRS